MESVSKDSASKFFISLIGLVVLFLVLKELQHIFIPLVMAYFLYFVFEPLNDYLAKKRVPQFLLSILDILIIVGLMFAVSRLIYNSFSQFSAEWPIYEERLNNLISTTASDFGIEDPMFTNFSLTQIAHDIDYGGIAGGFFSSTLSMFSTTFFVLFFFLFVSSGHKNVLDAVKSRLLDDGNPDNDEEDGKKVDSTFKVITHQVQHYLSLKFLLSLATGVLTGIILWIFGVDFALVWAILALLLNFIPTIGSIMGVVMPVLVAIVQFESFGIALVLAAILGTVQGVIGNIIEPKVFGDKLGLNPITVLLSLLLWGYIWGIVGMFISVPLTAIIKIIMMNSQSRNMHFLARLMSS